MTSASIEASRAGSKALTGLLPWLSSRCSIRSGNGLKGRHLGLRLELGVSLMRRSVAGAVQ